MSVFIGIIFFIACIYSFYKWNFFSRLQVSSKIILLAFIIKIIAGFAMIWVYTDYYENKDNNDVYKYYEDSAPIYESLFENPKVFAKIFFLSTEDDSTQPVYESTQNWYRPVNTLPTNNNRLMIRINTIFRILSGGGNIWVHTLFMCFIMMIASVWIYKFFKSYTPHKNTLFLVISSWPSVAFWSSPVMKESITLLGIGALLYALYFLKNNKSKGLTALFSLTGALLLIYIKIYILLLLIPGIILFLTKDYWKFWYRLILMYSIVLIGMFISDVFDSNRVAQTIKNQRDNFTNLAEGGIYFYQNDSIVYAHDEQRKHLKINGDSVSVVSSFQAVKRPIENSKDTVRSMVYPQNKQYEIYFNQKQSGSYLPIPSISAHTGSILINSPAALMRSFLRPYPQEVMNATTLMAFMEVLALIMLFIIGLFYKKNVFTMDRETLHLILSFSILLIILVGLTTPISGAIVRYRMPAFLLLSVLFTTQIDLDRVILSLRKKWI